MFNNDFTSLLSVEQLSEDYSTIALSNIADYINGLAMQDYPANKNEKSLPVLKIRELRQGYCDSNSDTCTPRIEEKYIITDGDVIFSWSGSLLVDIWAGGTVGLNQHLFNIKSSAYPKWFTYLWTKFYLKNFIRIADGKKTSMGHIKREDLDAAKVIAPSSNLLLKFNTIYQPIFVNLLNNKIELNILRKTNQMLLTTLSR